MTAPLVDSKITPPPVVKSTVGSFAIDPNFGQNQKIKVAIRLRPPLEDQDKGGKKKGGDKKAWNLSKTGAMDTLAQKGTARKVEGRTLFHFDQVFDEDTQTPFIYKSIARSMVRSVLDGKHATIFAYGQTGSGKTFTMQGDGKKQSGQAGIIQLVVADLFRFMRQGPAAKRDFIIKVCYVEVYNERIRDLLSDDVGSTASHGTPTSNPANRPSVQEKVTIRTTASGEVVMDCIQTEVKSVDEVLELLVNGNAQRVVAKTDMNNHSSRSHAIFRISVESRDKDGGENAVLRVSDFNLVDLAGSESVKVSNTTGLRLREGSYVNQSLLTLSSVIHSLGLPEKKRPKHINFRDSKLTRILQPHLSGNADMAILCCVSPSKAFIEETRSTLKFAARAKLVHITPKVNEVQDDSALIRKLKHELAEAKRQLEVMAKQGNAPPPPPPPPEQRRQSTTEKQGDGSEVDYGYEDMDAPQRTREYVMPKDQSLPSDSPFVAPKSQQPGVPGRNYVMPKDQSLPSDSPFVMPQSQPPGVPGRNYVMPKNQQIPQINNRPYVMPKNHDLQENSGVESFLQNQSDETEDEDLERMHDSANFLLDSVDPKKADKAVLRYMHGRTNSDDTDNIMNFAESSDDEGLSPLDRIDSVNSKANRTPPREFPMPGHYVAKEDYGTPDNRNETTAPTEDESYDGPEGSYAEISLKFGSLVSTPDTLRGESMQGARSQYGTIESAEDHALDGRANNTISWDTMDLNTTRPEHVGEPIRAMQSIYKRDTPVPKEITIMCLTPVDNKDELCLTDKLNEAEARSAFLQGKLDMSDDLVEAIFKDLERARLCIHDLVFRNVQLAAKLKEKRRDDLKEEYQEGEIVVEQYWLLKGAMYVGLFFFLTGGYEFFMATVILIWLILEANLSN